MTIYTSEKLNQSSLEDFIMTGCSSDDRLTILKTKDYITLTNRAGDRFFKSIRTEVKEKKPREKKEKTALGSNPFNKDNIRKAMDSSENN